jgi:hypothetical protein
VKRIDEFDDTDLDDEEFEDEDEEMRTKMKMRMKSSKMRMTSMMTVILMMRNNELVNRSNKQYRMT